MEIKCILNHLEICIKDLTSNANIISDSSRTELNLPPHQKSLSYVSSAWLARPDLGIHYIEANIIKIIERYRGLPVETNIEKYYTFKIKSRPYATLIHDIEDNQISSELTCVEEYAAGDKVQYTHVQVR